MNTSNAPFLSYSANNEDLILNRVFATQASGFFVDVGAGHPVLKNDTRALYDRGWRGINIEPHIELYRALSAERPRDISLNLAVSDEPGQITFYEIVGTGLSTCDLDGAMHAEAQGFRVSRHIVAAVALRDILADSSSPAIDVLKVDVAGFELKVMASNDWSRFRPKIVLAGRAYPKSIARWDDSVSCYLTAQGYRHVYFNGSNDFYAELSFTPPIEIFDRPPNIFENFVPYCQHNLTSVNSERASQIGSLRQTRETAGLHVESLRIELDNTRKQMRRIEILAQAQAIDLENAYAELISMRERGRALALAMDAVDMHRLEDDGIRHALRTLPKRFQRPKKWPTIYTLNYGHFERVLNILKHPRRTWFLLLNLLIKS